MIGQDAVFDRAEQRRDHAEQEQREEQQHGTECSQKPTTARKATPISTSFSRCATQALSKRSAISPPSADRKKNGAMNTGAVERDQHLARSGP